MTTHKKPPVAGGAEVGADGFRLINRPAANNTFKECLVTLGSGPNAPALLPFLEPFIRPELEKVEQKLKATLQKLVSPRRFNQALTAYTAHNAEQEQLKNQPQQKDLNYADSSSSQQ